MRTIQIISDVHTEFGLTPEQFRGLLDPADITVLAGDIVNNADNLAKYLEICKEFSKYVIFTCGNHEYYKISTDTDYVRVCNSIENVFFLQRRRIQVDGIWFAGATLWTNIEDYASQMMNDPFDASEIRQMHEKDIRWLEENAKKGDIIVTHHLPSLQLIEPKYMYSTINSGFASDLDELIEKIKPGLWICGHTHSPFDTIVCNCRVIINPVGYPNENPSFQKKIISFNNTTNQSS